MSSTESTDAERVLYIAEASSGLLRLTIPLSDEAVVAGQATTVELVSFELSDHTPIEYADDVAIGKSGMVYFSDASDIIPSRIPGTPKRVDTYSASVVDALRGKRSGKLLMYDPVRKETSVVFDGIWFANGVTLSEDESFALINETFMARVLKVYLEGSKRGEVEVFADGFPGYVDGVSISSTGHVHVAIPTPAPGTADALSRIKPSWLNRFFRTIVLALPFPIGPVNFGCFVTLDMQGNVLNTWVDEKGEVASFVTAVEERDGKAYLGSLTQDRVVVVDLA